MGTIADKLTRIITTKEDIRQALISKGYDVPTSIPFKEYAKMILDLPCKIDDFPELPGDVTRWHFGGLTNEMMAAMDDPRIEDADHKGRFLSFKNFAWKEGSGISDVYPGFILGDGVDDFAVTEKELNFEDTYTVYTAFIPFQNDPANNMVLCGKNHLKDFYITYSDLNRITFYSAEKLVFESLSKGFNILCCKRTPDKMVIKNLITDKSSETLANDLIDNPGLYYLWKGAVFANYAKAAIAGQTICNGYFSTDEDDEKVLNWYKKQYPWLFPDQAWTVTGKTNEDEDRATIANITGNGNDLVLSNFAFSGNSGYGLYAYNFNSFDLRDNVVKPTDVKKDSFRIIGTGNSGNVLVLSNTSNSAAWKIRITGMKEGDSCIVGNANKSGDYIKIIKDGIYTFQKQYAATSINGIWYNSSQEVDVLVEQIPEYEGYLVTDGVDDKAVSKQFKFGENFTVILDFKFPVKKISYCGFDLSSKVRIQNLQDSGVYVVLKGNKTLIPSNVVRAVTSEGKVYDENWNEYNIVPGNISSNYTMVNLGFDGSTQFAESATKLAGIYSSALSKDDCIKAYNYLQTLKSK